MRRARAWLPCVDTAGAACPYELRITVGEGEVAAAAGQLLRQTWAGTGRRTFHYRLQHATPPCHLALAVGAHNSPIKQMAATKPHVPQHAAWRSYLSG